MKKLSILLMLVVILSVVTGCVLGEESAETTLEQSESELTPTETTPSTETTVTPETTEVPETTVAPQVHAFGDWVDTKSPTCTLVGEKTRTCSCGEKEIASIDALGHKDEIVTLQKEIIDLHRIHKPEKNTWTL